MNKLNFSLLTTALLACGYSNFALASSKFTQVAEQNPAQQVEQSYYEDGEDFDTGANFQGKGWGWTNASGQANLLECTTDCTVGECTTSESTCTQSSSTETLTMLDVDQAKDETSPFYTEEQSHIAWAIVEDFNKTTIG